MSRRRADPIEVRRRDQDPEQFRWQGRLYLVHEVLARWVESGVWWQSAPARTLMAGEQTEPLAPASMVTAPIPASPKWGQRAWGEPAPDVGAGAGPLTVDDGEREFWRVEAAAGQAREHWLARSLPRSNRPTGIFDLSFDWSGGGWHLVQVLD